MFKLLSLERRLQGFEMLSKYDEQMKIIIQECAEPVSNDKISAKSGRFFNHIFESKPRNLQSSVELGHNFNGVTLKDNYIMIHINSSAC